MVILTYGPYVLPICAQYFRIAPTGLALHFGEVERMSTDKPGFYRLLMPNISHSSKGVGLECQIIETVADALLYTGLDFELVDTSLSPILDQFDVSPEQTYHQIKTSEGHCRTLKLYPFDNYRSSVFKHGLS